MYTVINQANTAQTDITIIASFMSMIFFIYKMYLSFPLPVCAFQCFSMSLNAITTDVFPLMSASDFAVNFCIFLLVRSHSTSVHIWHIYTYSINGSILVWNTK